MTPMTPTFPSDFARRIRPPGFARIVGLVLSCAGTFAACGGATAGSGGTSTVNGTINGQSVAAGYAVTYMTTEGFGEPDGGSIVAARLSIFVSNLSAWCAEEQSAVLPGNVSQLELVIVAPGLTNPPPAGSYPILLTSPATLHTPGAGAGYTLSDAGCLEVNGANAVSGNVTLTTSQGDLTEGSFDLTFYGGDHLTGTFTAPQCVVGTLPYHTQCGS